MSPLDGPRQQVHEFYSLLLRGRPKSAEKYVDPETLEIFRNFTNNRFLGFEIDTIELDKQSNNAAVTVQIIYQPLMFPRPMKYPRKTIWRLAEDGQWLLKDFVIPEPIQPPLKMFDSSRNQQTEEAKPELLRFEENVVHFGELRQGDKRQALFRFANNSDQPVTIAEVETGCICIKLVSELNTYGPGDTGELVFEFDSEGYLRGYKQTIVVRTDPGELRSFLMVEADIQPRRDPKPGLQDTTSHEDVTP